MGLCKEGSLRGVNTAYGTLRWGVLEPEKAVPLVEVRPPPGAVNPVRDSEDDIRPETMTVTE